jgi:long-chain acyl-CoA synthetase
MLASLGEILPTAASRFGDKTALISGDRRLGFNELDRLAGRAARGLRRLGVGPGDRVTLHAPNSWEWVVAYHAILRLGAVVNPVNALLTETELEFILRDCGARVAILSASKAASLVRLRDAGVLAAIVAIGDGAPLGAVPFEELVAGNDGGVGPVDVAADALSTIAYTSGTTGHPKGAMQSQRAVLMNVAMTAQMHARTAADTVVSALPCPHVYGNVVMNGALWFGMTLVLHAAFREAEILDSIERHRATMFEGVPTMYYYLLNHAELARRDLTSLDRCTVGGQTMPVAKMAEVQERFRCPLVELWGMTELAGLGTTHPCYGPIKLGSIGIALPHVEARIDPVEAGAKAAPGTVGELMIRGPIVMQGYYNNDKATRETIEPDGWLHTGDLAYADEDGAIFIVDRKKDLIISAGNNIYPAELERVISAHPAVAMVAVAGRPDPIKGETPKAYVVLRQGTRAEAEDIIAHCRKTLAPYKIPRAVAFVADLPKTSTGKILRRQLGTLD